MSDEPAVWSVWSTIERGTVRRAMCEWCGEPIEWARSVAFDVEVPFNAPLQVFAGGRVDLRQMHVWCERRRGRTRNP